MPDPAKKVFVCRDCGLKVKTKRQLRKHRYVKPGPLLAIFVCPLCKHSWQSAHAYCKSFQQCKSKSCKTKTYPQQAKFKKKGKGKKAAQKRHESSLCERCMKGLPCSAVDEEEAEEAELSAQMSRMNIGGRK